MWHSATSYDALSFHLPLKAEVLFYRLRGKGLAVTRRGGPARARRAAGAGHGAEPAGLSPAGRQSWCSPSELTPKEQGGGRTEPTGVQRAW